jgi:hypothetical protein
MTSFSEQGFLHQLSYPLSRKPPPYVVDTASLNNPRNSAEVSRSLTLQVRSQASTGCNGGRTDVGAESLRTALTAGDPLA